MGIVARFFKVGQAGANRLVDKLEKPEIDVGSGHKR